MTSPFGADTTQIDPVDGRRSVPFAKSSVLERWVCVLPEPAAARPWAGMALLSVTMLALIALLIWSAGHGHLPQFQGKAMEIRLVFVPFAAVLVPASWWLASHVLRRRLAFPFTPAVLVVLALPLDLVGNATRLYDTVEYFDDAVHAVNPVLLVAALALVLRNPVLPRGPRGSWRSVWVAPATSFGRSLSTES